MLPARSKFRTMVMMQQTRPLPAAPELPNLWPKSADEHRNNVLVVTPAQMAIGGTVSGCVCHNDDRLGKQVFVCNGFTSEE